MEDSSFFRDVHNVDITNGDFAVKYGPDNSHRTTNYGRVHNDYDHSRHNTHFERYNNHGQHIATNNGPVNFGHPPPDDGGYFYQDTRPHRPMRGRTPHMRYQAQARNYPGDPFMGSDRGFTGSSDNSRSSSVRGEGTSSRPASRRSDTQIPDLKEQFSKTSPALQEYIRLLQKQAKSRKSTSPSDDEDEEMDWEPAESDSEREEAPSRLDERDDDQTGAFHWEEPSMSFPAGRQRPSFDNRTYTMNVNSNNVNKTTIQDSYNDNSTSTVIREKASKRHREEPDD